ncbi:hypothetical protein ALC56_09721 [Trachymyrmex septentrionalis]|uniref:Uncharacterized protein n=1 Tax=Trachymyrmex septentrionalis TaxID=34720 RepID=A0A195F5R3_9HYME|nr:hypothetical protein ALC56_09721 [Trachymyrmex septentrionalis]
MKLDCMSDTKACSFEMKRPAVEMRAQRRPPRTKSEPRGAVKPEYPCNHFRGEKSVNANITLSCFNREFWLKPLTVPFKATRTTPFTMLESNVSNGKMLYVDVTPIANSPGAKSLEAVERELTVRGVRTASRTPEFSLLRECNELAIPFDWLHLRGSRMVTSAFVISSTRARISRKRLFEFPPTALRSDTRYREVVTVYYTSFNWHPGFVNSQPSCIRYPIQSSLSQTDISIFVTTDEMALVDTGERDR